MHSPSVFLSLSRIPPSLLPTHTHTHSSFPPLQFSLSVLLVPSPLYLPFNSPSLSFSPALLLTRHAYTCIRTRENRSQESLAPRTHPRTYFFARASEPASEASRDRRNNISKLMLRGEETVYIHVYTYIHYNTHTHGDKDIRERQRRFKSMRVREEYGPE